MGELSVRARIADIVTNKYVVTYPTNDTPEIERGESITFAPKDWQGPSPPVVGQIAFLTGVQKFVRGWRASKAEPALLSKAPTRAKR